MKAFNKVVYIFVKKILIARTHHVILWVIGLTC